MRRRDCGFTLIELITVMALLALIAAVSAPRLAGFVAGRNVEEECRRFVALTQFASEESVSRGERIELWIRPAEARYGLRGESASIIEFRCQDKLTLSLPGGILTDDGTATILYWPDGSIDTSSPATIELTEAGTPVFEIVLDENATRYIAAEVPRE